MKVEQKMEKKGFLGKLVEGLDKKLKAKAKKKCSCGCDASCCK